MEDPGDGSSDSVRGALEDTALHLSGQCPVLYTRCVDGIQQIASSGSLQQQNPSTHVSTYTIGHGPETLSCVLLLVVG